ncbi:4Fe-4S binding protein [Eubacteriaceae bacterium ES2]|nr:4Fe-4S binding protein [Eubacteriaceae bacterium ES2]
MDWKKVSKWGRLLVLAGLLIWVIYESYMHQVLGGGKAPSVHALCPYGALESLYTLLLTGTFIKKIYSGTLVLLILTVVLALLFRRSFCGLLCPFGALQEFFARLGQKIFKKRFVIPEKVDRPLRYLKYVVLVLTAGLAWYYGTLWMSPYDPYAAFSHITVIGESIEEDPLAIIGFIILFAILIGSLLYDRFFCKYLCPAGAVYAIIGKISPTKVERNDELCVHCKKCDKVCPVNIKIEQANQVTTAECINCNECVLECPVNGALEVKVAKKPVLPVVMLVLVVGIFFGTIGIAQLTGNFDILPKAVAEGETIAIYEVKGYNTIEEAADLTGLTVEEVYEQLAIPTSVPQDTQFKNISAIVPEYSFDTAKENAEAAINGTSTTDSSSGENTEAADVSGIKGSMTIQEAMDSIGMKAPEFYRLFEIPDTIPAQTLLSEVQNLSPGYDFQTIKSKISGGSGETAESNNTTAVDISEIKGSMTIQQAMDSLGMEATEFYALFSIPDSVPASTLLKEVSTQVPGYDFQTVKNAIQ